MKYKKNDREGKSRPKMQSDNSGQRINIIELRQYQVAALDALRKKYASGTKRVLLISPTGSGKSLMFCEILRSAYEKGRSAIMVVRGRSLVDQASEKLADYNVPHGVRMASHWNNRPHERIQVCSIDTLYRRKIAPDADIIVIDESHTAGGDSYAWLFAHYPDALFLPVTATPYLKKGMRHIADDYVQATTMRELIDTGYLVPLKYFAPSTINLTNVKIDSTGDYNAKQLYEASDDTKVYGDLVANYQKLIPGLTAIAYGVNVDHSKKIADSFIKSGIPALHIDANTPLAERKMIIAKLVAKEILIISSVGTMTTGIDIPSLEAIIVARPTTSLNLHLQIIGRVTRIYPGKCHGIVLDHAGNIVRHGLAEFDRAVNLDGFTPKESDIKPVTCKQCYAVFCPLENYLAAGIQNRTKRYYVCPACKHDNAPAQRDAPDIEMQTSDDELLELGDEQIETLLIRNKYAELEVLRKRTKNKDGKTYNWQWTFYRLIAEYGEPKIKQAFPSQMKSIKWRHKT